MRGKRYFQILLISFSVLVLLPHLSFSQEDTADFDSPFTLSFGAGLYHSNHATARYYNGETDDRLKSVLSLRQSEIRDDLGGYNFTLEEFAQDMTYRSAIYFELQIGYHLKNNWAVKMNFMNAQLRANGVFTLRVERQDPNNNINPVLELVNISGKETRSHIGFGVSKKMIIGDPFFVLLEGGIDFTFLETRESLFTLGNKNYNIPPTSDLQNPNQEITTIGTGGYGLAALGLQLPSDYSLILQLKYLQTKLNVAQVEEAGGSIYTASLIFSKRF